MPLRDRRLSVAAGSSDARRARVVAVAGPVAVAVPGDVPRSIVGPPRRRASSCRSIPPAGGPGDVPCRRSGPSRPSCVAVAEPLDGGGPAVADPPVWRIEEDVIAGSVTVHVHDGGEEIVPDGRRLYAAETLRMTAWDADPARAELDADVVYRWQDARHAVDDHRDPARRRPARRARATDFDLAVRLEVDVDGEPLLRARLAERIPRHLV